MVVLSFSTIPQNGNQLAIQVQLLTFQSYFTRFLGYFSIKDKWINYCNFFNLINICGFGSNYLQTCVLRFFPIFTVLPQNRCQLRIHIDRLWCAGLACSWRICNCTLAWGSTARLKPRRGWHATFAGVSPSHCLTSPATSSSTLVERVFLSVIYSTEEWGRWPRRGFDTRGAQGCAPTIVCLRDLRLHHQRPHPDLWWNASPSPYLLDLLFIALRFPTMSPTLPLSPACHIHKTSVHYSHQPLYNLTSCPCQALAREVRRRRSSSFIPNSCHSLMSPRLPVFDETLHDVIYAVVMKNGDGWMTISTKDCKFILFRF